MKNIPALDGIRAVAVWAVIAHHTLPAGGVDLGGRGVWVFFVLSGFLITGILLDARGKGVWPSLKVFYARRALRIFPAYYLMLLVAVVAIPQVRSAAAWHAAYLSNFYFAARGEWDAGAHLWSLSVEEQFYLVWPLVVLAAPARTLLPLFLSGVTAGVLSRYFLYEAVNPVAAYSLLPSNLDCLCLGSLLAWCHRNGGAGIVSWAAILSGAAFTIAGVASTGAISAAATALGTGLIATWGVHVCATRRVPPLEWQPVAYLGRISYGIYLWHNFVIAIGIFLQGFAPFWLRIPTSHGLPMFAFVSVASVAIASISWFLVERPALRLKRLVEYR